MAGAGCQVPGVRAWRGNSGAWHLSDTLQPGFFVLAAYVDATAMVDEPLLVPCPACGERTLRDPARHSYDAARCAACGAEVEAVGIGQQLRAVPPAKPPGEPPRARPPEHDPRANGSPDGGVKVWLLKAGGGC